MSRFMFMLRCRCK